LNRLPITGLVDRCTGNGEEVVCSPASLNGIFRDSQLRSYGQRFQVFSEIRSVAVGQGSRLWTRRKSLSGSWMVTRVSGWSAMPTSVTKAACPCRGQWDRRWERVVVWDRRSHENWAATPSYSRSSREACGTRATLRTSRFRARLPRHTQPSPDALSPGGRARLTLNYRFPIGLTGPAHAIAETGEAFLVALLQVFAG
jgi:hypothetical protein